MILKSKIDGVKDDYYGEGPVTEETKPGGFIALNDDDDNNNGTPDKDESGVVAGENDLVKITLQPVLTTYLTGNVTLETIAGGEKIQVWDNPNKAGSPLSLPKNYATPTELPKDLWVEGIGLSSTPRDITLALEYAGFEDRIKATVVKVEIDGPDDVVLGEEFSISVSTGASWTGTADITIESGAGYSYIDRTESYWDADHNIQTSPAYRHEFGLKLPTPATVAITDGSGSFSMTEFSMEGFAIKVKLQGIGCEGIYQVAEDNVWAKVKATYIGEPLGPESEHDWPGYFDNDKPRAALPYGATNLFNSWIVAKKNLADSGVDVKIRDRGPWFPYGIYSAGNDWYNEYWDDGGWKPLAVFMQALRRVGSDLIINGAGLDLTQNAIESLGFTWNQYWSGNVYWRLK